MEVNVSSVDSILTSKVIDNEKLGESNPNAQYHIAKSQKFHEDVYCFADDESNDPATLVSLSFSFVLLLHQDRTLSGF